MKKRILCTGSGGQLGKKLRELLTPEQGFEFLGRDIDHLDITKKDQVFELVESLKPDAMVNTAAYTAVDKAEEEKEQAFLVNATGVEYLAGAAARNNLPFFHVSTDYVFDGRTFLPYREDQKPNPLSAYAGSKAEGEQHCIRYHQGYLVRTSWLYSEYGHNFVKTMLRLGHEGKKLRVVSDQVGSPTYAGDLAQALATFLTRYWDHPAPAGIYHYSNEGIASWYDLAMAALDLAGIKADISPVRTEEYPLPAPRPFYSVMDKQKIKNELGLTIPHWRESLRHCVEKIIIS